MSLSTSVLGTAPVHDPRERQKCTREPFTRKRHCWYKLRTSQSPSSCALRHVLMNSALIDDVTFCETPWITLMAAATTPLPPLQSSASAFFFYRGVGKRTRQRHGDIHPSVAPMGPEAGSFATLRHNLSANSHNPLTKVHQARKRLRYHSEEQLLNRTIAAQ